MQHVLIEFYYQVNDRGFRFQVEPNTPFSDAKEAAALFLRNLCDLEESGKARESAEEEKPVEVSEV